MDLVREEESRQFVENYNRIINELSQYSRNSCTPKLCVVTKRQSSETVKSFITRVKNPILGENRVNEALMKIKACGTDKATWHFIGHLQRNKVKLIIDKVSLIESLDRIELAEEIEKRASNKNLVVNCLVQVDVAQDGTKFGISPDIKKVEEFLLGFDSFNHIRIKGFMTIAPFTSPKETRPYFRQLYEIFTTMKQKQTLPENVKMETLSMGMSNDYQIALEEGSTLIRLGTAIFGESK